LARFSSGGLRLRFCLGQRIRTAKGRETKRRRKGAGRDQEEAWVESSGSQEKRGVKAKGDLEKKSERVGEATGVFRPAARRSAE
jgi:hypothetical protein